MTGRLLRPCCGAGAVVVSGPLVDLADGRQVQLRDVELVRVEHLVQRTVERRVGLRRKRAELRDGCNIYI